MSFELTTLGEYAKVQGGYAYKSEEFSDSGKYPVLKIKNVRFGNVDYSEASFISEKIANETIEWKTKEGDILISMTGSGPNAPQSLVGRVARVWADEPEAWINQRVGRLVLKEEAGIHPDFLFYLLGSPRSQDFLVSNSSGSANQANISGKTIESLPCPKVDYEQSAEIAKILRELDQKILINRQTNQTLEQIAQAIFKSWFVDFEPVKAKMAAKQTGAGAEQIEQAAICAISGKTPEQLAQLDPQTLQQLKTTAALFPDALVDSELGEIPEGWIVREIKELASIISKGTTPTKADISGTNEVNNIPFLKVRDISDDGIISRIDLDKIPEAVHIGVLKRSILKENDILFSIAGTIGRVALIEEDLSNSNCNQALAFIRLENSEKYLDLCRLNLAGERVRNEVISKVVQGVQANFSLGSLGGIKLIIPSENLLSGFNKTLRAISKKQRLLLAENRKLTDLRDTLLPKLLSGEVTLANQKS